MDKLRVNESKIQEATRDFALKGFEHICGKPQLDDTHRHVLKNKYDNFFGKPDFKLHRWAGSLTSSQAFAYNIFSGVKGAKFEYDMWALDSDPLHKACIDVAIEDEKGDYDMYEVKMFEFATSVGINQIFHKNEQKKYFAIENYCCSTDDVAKYFKQFIGVVKEHFKGCRIYGEGIKQLCCHLLGITNEMTKCEKLQGKNVRLYSLCFDHNIDSEYFKKCFEGYQQVLEKFSPMVNEYLINVKLKDQIEYCGFVSAKGFIEDKKELLGTENYEYVKKRYFDKATS